MESNKSTTSAPAADIIYQGGDIVTICEARPLAEALAVVDGKILAVGSEADVMAFKGPETEIIDLGGKTMMPGLIDAHSHVAGAAAKLYGANISAPPVGPAASLGDLKEILVKYIKDNNIQPGGWVFGMGYDDTAMKEKRHPDRDFLDEVSSENPIFLAHASGHLVAANSLTLKLAGIDETTEDPEGGVIQRRPGSREPNGVLEETARTLILGAVPMPSLEQAEEKFIDAINYYVSHGVTTAQEGAISLPPIVEIYKKLGSEGRLPIDVVGYPEEEVSDQMLDGWINDRAYQNHYRMGGMKMFLDGSIQGYTAYLKRPFHVQPEYAADDPGYRGYPMIETQAETDRQVLKAYQNDWPLLCHTNGDAATDMFLDAVEKSEKAYPGRDRRTVIIHAQTMRDDQLDLAKKLGMVPSFFPGHVYYWGDRHRDLFLGPERAARVDPLKSALDRGLIFTGHHDCPVTPVNIMTIVWAGANRVTSSGMVLGPEERIPVIEALKMVTINAAYQYFEEDKKGSLEPGKLADLVILSDNPLKIDPMAIKDIIVEETIKEGVSVYRKQNG